MTVPAAEGAAAAPGPLPVARGGTDGGEAYVLRLAPDLRNVGEARAKLGEVARFWGTQAETVDDARVVLTELLSNGVLHARTRLDVVISRRGRGLRLEVHDASASPLVPPPAPAGGGLDLAAFTSFDAPAATGRGLAMVKALASTWGWFPDTEGGKVVWAEVGTATAGPDGERPAAPERAIVAVRPVRLLGVPVRLLKASEDHFDDLFRELQMANLGALDGPARPTPITRLAPRAEDLKARLAPMRDPVRRAVWEAGRRGDRLVELDLLADSGLPEVFSGLADLLLWSTAAARRGYLLTEPPSPEVISWRQWLGAELARQVGGSPQRACPFPTLAPGPELPAGAGRSVLGAGHRRALDELEGALAQARAADMDAPADADAEGHGWGQGRGHGHGEEALVARALARIVSLAGAARAVTCLLAEDNDTLRFGASQGFSAEVADYWQTTSLSSDLPASEVVRTGRPLVFRTAGELQARYPVFLSTPSEADAGLACLPLVTEPGGPIGALVLAFAEPRGFGPEEVGFLEALAHRLAACIEEGRAEVHRRAARELRRAAGRAERAILAGPSREEVLRELADAVAGAVCDGSSVHLVGPDGAVRFFMSRHRDPERLAAAVALWQKRQQRAGDTTSADIVAECARTGRPVLVQVLSDDAMAAGAADDEELVLLRRLALGSVGAAPVSTAAGVVAVLGFGNNAGRFVLEDDLAVITRLAAAAGTALARLGF